MRENARSGHVRQTPPGDGRPRADSLVGRRFLGAELNPRAGPTIILENLTLGYDRRPAVHHVSGEIASGDLLAVCGPNGGGKSTLIKGLAGLLAPMGGRILRGGARAGDFAHLPQAAEIDRTFPICIQDFIALGGLRRTGIFKGFDGGEDERVAKAIEAVGLSGI